MLPRSQGVDEGSGGTTGLDHVDLAILRALASDCEATNKVMAARIGIAESTCAYRVRVLRGAGVIAGKRVELGLAALGFPIQAIIKVRLESHDAAHVNSLFDRFTRVPGVISAYNVAGEDDFHLHVAVETPEALRDLVLKHVTVNPVVRQTQTQLIFEVRPGAGVLAEE